MSARWSNATVPSAGVRRGQEHYDQHPYVSALNTASREIVWLVEVDAARYTLLNSVLGPLAPNASMPNASLLKGVKPSISTVVLRWASRPFISANNDLPAKTFIDGRLRAPGILKELGATSDGAWGGLVRTDVGEIELSNDDGELDHLGINYVFEGRRMRVYAGSTVIDGRGFDQAPAIGDMALVYSGEVERWSYSRNSARLIVRNRPAGFDRLIKGASYAGHGGSSGTEAMAGMSRPLCLGNCYNVPAVLVDPELLIYQINDGEVRDIVTVREYGREITFLGDVETYSDLADVEIYIEDGGEIIFGYYTCESEGFFRLTIIPYGTVTADVLGYGGRFSSVTGLWEGGRAWEGQLRWRVSSTAPYRDKAGGLAGDILTRFGGVSINKASFDSIDRDIGRTSGIFIGPNDNVTVADAVDRLLSSIPAMLSYDVSGQWWARKLTPPGDEPKAVLTNLEILRTNQGPEIERPELNYGRPWPSWRVSYGTNWHVLSPTEIAEATLFDERTILTQKVREAAVSNATLNIFYSDRKGGIFESYLKNKADAEDLIARYFDMYSKDRQMFRLTVKGHLFLHDIGDTIAVNHRRYGLSGLAGLDIGSGNLLLNDNNEKLSVSTGPRNFLIVGLREDGVSRSTEITLWG